MPNSDLPKPLPTTATIPVRKRERPRDLHKLRDMWGHLFVFQSFDGAYFPLLVSRSRWNLRLIFGKIRGMDLNVVKCVKWR